MPGMCRAAEISRLESNVSCPAVARHRLTRNARHREPRADGVKAVLFAERRNGARRVAVCWRDGNGTLDLARLKLSASAKGYDIFGNELNDLAAAARSLAFTPIYVAWEASRK